MPFDLNKFNPRSDYHLVRFTTPATETDSGIILPEISQKNHVEVEILKSGPGFAIPPGNVSDVACRAFMWGMPGNVVVIEKHSFIPLAGLKEGLVYDSDLVGLVRGDEIFPFNDWVKLTIPDKPEKIGSIYLPELDQQKINQAVVTAVGPGKLKKTGKFTGTRTPIWCTMGLESTASVLNKIVFWSNEATLLEMGRDRVECCFIQAEDLCGILGGES